MSISDVSRFTDTSEDTLNFTACGVWTTMFTLVDFYIITHSSIHLFILSLICSFVYSLHSKSGNIAHDKNTTCKEIPVFE